MRKFFLAGAMVAGLCAPVAANEAATSSPVDATIFVAKAEAELATAYEFQSRTLWLRDTGITPDTEWLYARASTEQSDLAARYAREAARYDHATVDPATRRKLNFLKRNSVLPASSAAGASADLAEVTGKLETRFAKSLVRHREADQDYNALNVILGKSRNPDEMQLLWEGWRKNFPPMAQEYARLIELANAGARELGHADVGALWRSQYDMPESEFAALIERLWSQVEPLYKNLHCYARGRLNDLYKDGVQARSGPMRADLLGHLSAFAWDGIYDVLAPPALAPSPDITKLLTDGGYDAKKIVKTAESFYTSLGFAPLPETFWQRSMLTKPADRDVACHPTAFTIDLKADVRIKVCFKPDAYAFNTAHHELGHLFYYLSSAEQPFMFNDGANDGFHEAVGDFITLSAATPAYLRQIGLLPNAPDADGGVSELLRYALEHVAILPFSIIMDKWRWHAFSGETQPADYNKHWWSLVRQYQGLVPPAPRPDDAFDPGAHYHIPASVPYTRYFLAEIYQFQFHRAACRLAGWNGPLNRCSIYGNTQVGDRFKAMLRLGASKPWREALFTFTGESDADASAILEYFAPLDRWLTEQNKGERCGW